MGRLSLAVALGVVGSGLGAQGPYTIGPGTQVSRSDSSRSFFETQIGADPRNARHLVACAIRQRGDTTDNLFFVSFDRGSTWSRTLLVPHSVDPSCAIAADGTTYAVSVQDSQPSGASYLNVHRSVDGGRTWRESPVQLDTRSVDRAYVTIDDSPSRGGHRVYVHGYLQAPRETDGKRGPATAVLYTSVSSGAAIDRVVASPGAAFKAPWFFPANGVVSEDGTFVGLLAELDNTRRNMFLGRSDSASAPHAPNGVMRVIRSRSDGRSLESFPVGEAYYDWRVPQLSMGSLAIDRSAGPLRGRLYAVWPDARFGRRTQILLSTSDDGGRTWTAPHAVSDTPELHSLGHRPNDFMPMIAVNRDGVVGLSWYDRRDNPNNLSYWPRFAASLDGGESWLPSVRVSSSPNELTEKDRQLNGGDTSGLAVDAGGAFHPMWIDNRTGVPQAWTTTVTVRGTVHRRTQ